MRHIFFFVCIASIVFHASANAEWRMVSGDESAEFSKLFSKAWNDGDKDAQDAVGKLPSHIFFAKMMTLLSDMDDKPEIFERFRSMVLARPDWTEWAQWKIDWSLEQLDKHTEESSRGLHDLDKLRGFLYMLGTADVVPFTVQYLDIHYEPGGATGRGSSLTGFQKGAAMTLRDLQIPGGPDSNDVYEWKEWWKKNAHLYEKGPDGKVHGPAPTRLWLMNGKISEPLPRPPKKVYLTAPPSQTPTPRQAPAATPKPPTTAPQPAIAETTTPATGRWLLPAAIASGLGVIAVLALLFRRRKDNSE